MLVDAYLQCKPEHLNGLEMAVILDDMVTPFGTIIHAYEVFRDAAKVICHCRIDEPIVKALAEVAQVENPLDISVVIAVDITWAYLGRTLEGVFVRYPELNGTKIVFDGADIRYEPIIAPHVWA